MENHPDDPMCEKKEIYHILMVAAGFFGAYTFLLHSNVFCNAQTGNVVLMGMALGAGNWREALHYLIPISAYVLGAFVSELLPNPVKRHLPIRWDTPLLLGVAPGFFLYADFVGERALKGRKPAGQMSVWRRAYGRNRCSSSEQAI